MGFVLIACALAAGWPGWTWWVAVPLGFISYIDLYRRFPERAARIASSAWLSSPLYYVFFIAVGYYVHRWI